MEFSREIKFQVSLLNPELKFLDLWKELLILKTFFENQKIL